MRFGRRRRNNNTTVIVKVTRIDLPGQKLNTTGEDSKEEEYDDGDDERICQNASIACLQCIHDHVVEYLNKHIVSTHHQDRHCQNQEEKCSLDDSNHTEETDFSRISRRSSCTSSSLSYEDWISECHPENTKYKNDNLDKKHHGYAIDSRFYLLTSDHRIIWNGYVKAYGHPELKVKPSHNLIKIGLL